MNYNEKTKKHWISGPVSDKRYNNAFIWSNSSQMENSNGPFPVLPYKKWLKLKRYYFYLEDYEEFKEKDMIGIVHHSAIWVIDSKTYRLYYVAGSS